MLKQEWEIKESIIRSIAWNEPDKLTRFNLRTFKEDVNSAETMQDISNGSLIYLYKTISK